MGIFSSIMDKIFQRESSGPPAGTAREASGAQTAQASSPPGAGGPASSAMATVDVEAVLSGDIRAHLVR